MVWCSDMMCYVVFVGGIPVWFRKTLAKHISINVWDFNGDSRLNHTIFQLMFGDFNGDSSLNHTIFQLMFSMSVFRIHTGCGWYYSVPVPWCWRYVVLVI